MSFYEPQGWQAPTTVRQTSWEQPAPPSRSGASSSSQREDGAAFAIQFEEVDRAVDNLVKSGKFYQAGPRRDSMPMMMNPGRQYHDSGHRMHGSRHSTSHFSPQPTFPHANRQNFYASQRYQGHQGGPSRQNDVDPAFQAKKRMAQSRERDLRNYHQEQQYNRSVLADMSSTKSDRSMSPSTMSEEGRRDLLARQHRALYGNGGQQFVPGAGFMEDPQNRDPSSADNAPGRGPSPRVELFGAPSQAGSAEQAAQAAAQESGREKATSPAGQSGPAFGSFEGPIQSAAMNSPASGEESAHSRQISKSTTAPISGAMGPIGSRPGTQGAPGQGIKQRTTSPLPGSMAFGFNAADQNNERSTSSNSNTGAPKENASNPALGGWGSSSGVWGSNKIGATSVWG